MFDKIKNTLQKVKVDDFIKSKLSTFSDDKSNKDLEKEQVNDEKNGLQIEEEQVDQVTKVEKKVVNQVMSTVIKTQIKVYIAGILGSLLTLLLPIIIFLFVIMVIYYIYIVSLQNQYAQQMIEQQTPVGTLTNAQAILGSHGVTQGGSGVPVGSPTVGQFKYSTFKFHQDYEYVTAIDFTPKVTGTTEIRSTQAGTVLYAEDNINIGAALFCSKVLRRPVFISGYGKTVIIGNKDTGYVTLYLHLDEINPDLKVGDQIGYGTYLGTMGNTGCSKGKHLHYEIRKGPSLGADTDFPSYNSFNVSGLTRAGFTTIGIDQYLSNLGDSITQVKNNVYTVDFTVSKFEDTTVKLDSSNLNSLSLQEQQLYGPYVAGRPTPCGLMQTYKTEGTTEEERTRFMLEKRAIPEFKDYDTWKQAGIDGQIQPALLVCIGVKESNLGNRLKSKNNVGNVGNTDSGATRDFATPYDGIRGITDLSLNGKYLRHINEIVKLSKCGDPSRAPVYATSDVDYVNLLGCVSSIKNSNIPDNWNFRLSSTQILQAQQTADSQQAESQEQQTQLDFVSDNSLYKFVSPQVGFIKKEYSPQVVDISGDSLSLAKPDMKLRQDSLEQLRKFSKEYKSMFGKNLVIASGYRDYKYQLNIENKFKECVSTNYCAKAGFSEHQTGLAVDLIEVLDSTTKDTYLKKFSIEYKWFSDNAHKFGFTQSYKNGVGVEGYHEEPWHWRYIGIDLATKLKETNQSFTQYYTSLKK